MTISEIKQSLREIIDSIPEDKLEVLLDFASYLSYLKEKEKLGDFLTLQRSSAAYQEWVGGENDIYDQVFGAVKANADHHQGEEA